MTLPADQLKQLGAFCGKTAATFFDTVMDTALQCVGLSKTNWRSLETLSRNLDLLNITKPGGAKFHFFPDLHDSIKKPLLRMIQRQRDKINHTELMNIQIGRIREI